MSGVGRLGVGLWTFQSTAGSPAGQHQQYRAFAEDAALLERLGFHSAWTAEHRAWYDGWCPAPLHALALAAAGTSRLRLGTSMLLLPQHGPVALARAAATLDRLTGGRLDLGVGLGHRDAEFDALGLRRDRRGRLMDAALAALAATWAGEHGDAPPAQRPGPPLWLGAIAPAAFDRAARGGHRLMLPQTLRAGEFAARALEYRATVGEPAVIGVMRDVWVEPDAARAERVRARLLRHYREEAGAWWQLQGRLGFSAPELLERQLGRVVDCALVGGPEHVADGLQALLDGGADLIVIRPVFDFVERAELHEQLERIAADVAPRIGSARAAA